VELSDTRHTVLVVDDTPDNITILATSLGDTFRVRAATSGERALAICRSDMPPDIVLLDVVMPSLDGFEVCRQLKADPLTAGIPVLFVTGNTDQEDEARGFALGAVDYISRPIKVELVRRRVQVHLDLQDARRRIEELNRQYACYLPTQLARKLDTGGFEAEPVAHRRKLTVFFSDIVAFTQHTESLAPEHLAILLNGYFEAMNEVVDRHGGTLDKFMGDGMMVFFGAPESRGEVEDAEACVRMALDMQDLLVGMRAEWFRQGIASPLRVRMGIATDYCHVGSFGSTRRLDYTVIGRSVNLASRLQSAASPDTRAGLADHARAAQRPPRVQAHGPPDAEGPQRPHHRVRGPALDRKRGARVVGRRQPGPRRARRPHATRTP
jgi:adenylate cyclase